MNKIQFLLAYLGLILFSSIILAEKPNENAVIYMVKSVESLDQVATKLLPRYKTRYNNRLEEFKADLMKWNPHITSWNAIPSFSNLYIEYPYPIYIPHEYAPSLERHKNYTILNADAETPLGSNKFTLFSMFTTSAGNFTEELKTQNGSIKSTQNSPYSFGLGSTIFLDKTKRMISSSVYWSSLTSSKLSGTTSESGELEVKPEIGLNLYFQQVIPYGGISLYGGVDYEQFSTFNTQAFVNGANLALNQNKIMFATLGAGKTFFWGDQKILVKSSFSQSVSSKSTSLLANDIFEGNRFLLFASLKGDSRLTYHVIFKRHMLDGPTQLTINRIGAGIGLVIF